MTRRRRAAVALWVTSFLVGVVALGSVNSAYVALRPFGDLARAWFVMWGLAIIGVLLWRPTRRGVLVGAVPFVALAWFTGFAAWMSLLFGPAHDLVVRRIDAGDHEVRLVHLTEGIEPIWEVRVRTREGLLSREWDVWGEVGYISEEPVVTVTGPRSLDVRDTKGVVHHVTF